MPSHAEKLSPFPGQRYPLARPAAAIYALLQPNVTLSELISGLNALGVTPQEMADIIRAMKAAGAVQAELVIR
jgi:flagellar P-ring protein precursor FlgI